MSDDKGRQVGPYSLEARLGRGAQGDVFRARHMDTREFVAVKLFPLGLDSEQAEETRRRVQREVKALQGLTAPSIVRIKEHGEQGDKGLLNTGYVWVAYELINGISLDNALAASFPPQPADCLAFLERISPDLQQAHDLDLVHRDIKPSNILLRDNEWGDPVLVDFGYVKQLATGTLTITGRAVGTMGYMAPEVLRSPAAASAASDRWSLARVYSEALSIALGADSADPPQAQCDDLLNDFVLPQAPATAEALRQCLASGVALRPSDLGELVHLIRDAMLHDSLISEVSRASVIVNPWNRRESLREYFERLGYPTKDKRSRPGGCLWIVGEYEAVEPLAQHLATAGVTLVFAPNGGKATGGCPGWWTRAAG